MLVNVELLQQGAEHRTCIENLVPVVLTSVLLAPLLPCSLAPFLLEARFEQARQVFPEELPAINDLAVPHVEEIDGQRSIFKVVAKNIGVVLLFGRCNALLLLQLMHRRELVAQPCSSLKLFRLGGGIHAHG